MKHPHTLRRLCLLTRRMFILALIAMPAGLFAQKPIVLLEPLPDGTTEISVAPGSFPLAALNAYLNPFMTWGFGVAAALTVLMIIVGGFQIMLAGGNEGERSKGKDRILAALAGLLLLVFSATILNMLNASFFRLVP
jgi:hypothetical protein